ncbi:glycosyltransferase family 4 protein [Paraburkholderia sp. A1RO-5]|uniref:glycosyltransferase n=1 Tax=Paraburkholderia sp. A1RO-5 TaxID=3028369 RepID=UPI003B785394
MKPLRILVLAPWPFRKPKNGGQLRGAAVVQAYRDSGHIVHTVALYDPGRVRQDEIWSSDIPITAGVGNIIQRPNPSEASSALVFWNAVAEADDSFAAFTEAVEKFEPDVVQFEEPFLWPVVRRLKAQRILAKATVVHSSYNFETEAWRDLRTAGADISDRTLRDIEALEKEIATSCDLIITVSRSDAEDFRSLGAEAVCITKNGVTNLLPEKGDIEVLQTYRSLAAPSALFVSSAHPPNAHGLIELAVAAQGHPVRSGEILICGHVGKLIRSAKLFKRAAAVLDRARYLGWVGDSLLSALYYSCRVVILPKTLGGGSNLKTAEALASGRPIVATTNAFRGFEDYADLPGITIADDPHEFWSAVNARLTDTCIEETSTSDELKDLLWTKCLTPMVRAVEAIHETVSQIKISETAL